MFQIALLVGLHFGAMTLLDMGKDVVNLMGSREWLAEAVGFHL